MNKEVIESEARKAACEGVPIRDACPYPFSSEEGKHFVAVYWLNVPHTVSIPTVKLENK